MKLEIGDAVKTELCAGGPKVTGTVTKIYPGGQFVEVRLESRGGFMLEVTRASSGCEKVDNEN